jgi:hypothetical protein
MQHAQLAREYVSASCAKIIATIGLLTIKEGRQGILLRSSATIAHLQIANDMLTAS